uniref:Uncharacterized protein n=1 Tax=Solibacter usitatus (strain Ellin6076) TaxID=234267 RepID=Q023L2_SOLUE
MALNKSLGIALLAVAALSAKTSTSLFEIRGVTTAPSTAAEKMTYSGPDHQTQSISVQKRPLLDLSAVESATVVGDTLQITLTPSGSLRLAQSKHRIAILIDGKVRDIQPDLKGAVITVHGLSPAEATDLAARINAAAGK